MGTSYILYAAILYVVSETLPLTYWVYTKVYGSLFVNFVSSILVGVIVILKMTIKMKNVSINLISYVVLRKLSPKLPIV